MDTIHDLAVALAAISDRQLHGLRAAIEHSPDVAQGLLAWLEHAVDWESHRRLGRHYRLQGPSAAIDTVEVNNSLAALAVLAATFRHTPYGDNSVVADFLEVSAAILRAEVERPDQLQ
jgi:hypothetical protein